MDFDGDGDSDVLSGSWPGQLYLFRRQEDGSFAAGETLRNESGEEIEPGSATTVFAADWDADGDLDLITGNIRGEVNLIVNNGTRRAPAYGDLKKLATVAGRGGDSGPIVADWNHDGADDILVGNGDGSVVWYRNTGTPTKPELAEAEELVPKSGFGFDFSKRKPGMWGARVKIHAVDFNGDGRLDLLLGDRSGSLPTKDIELTEKQKKEMAEARKREPEARKKFEEALAKIRRLQKSTEGDSPELKKLKDKAVEDYQQAVKEYLELQEILRQDRPQPVRHGFVWLFLRKPAEQVAGR